MKQSLQLRLSLWLSLIILAMALVAGALSFVAAFDEAIELQDDQLRQIGALVGRRILPGHDASAQQAGGDADAQRRIVVQSLPPADGKAAAPMGELADLPPALGEGLQTQAVHGERWRLLVIGPASGPRYAIGQRTAARDEIARDSALRTTLPLFVLIPILLLVVGFLIRRIFRPVRRLALALDRRREHDLGAIADADLPSEINPFVVAINRLLARVARSIQMQQRFVADAAHELRTPLTALTLQAERAEAAATPAETLERLGTLRLGLKRTRSLLDQLLILARAQAVGRDAAEPVSVQPVVREVIEELMPLADAKGIDLGMASASDGWIAASEVDLKTLLRNLVENAIRYSSSGGRVDLAVLRDAGRVVLLVDDSGPGITEAERDRVFDPFYRVLGTAQAGSGLGLSIVRAIADRIGAQISLSGSRLPGSASGLGVTVVFPPSRQA